MTQGTEDAGTVTAGYIGLLAPSEPDGRALAEQVAHQLETAITIGLLNDGERLPSEADLSAQLGVSTITLRQALASLRSRGLIATRRGRGGGSIVCGTAAVPVDEARRRLRGKSTEELRDLGDFCSAVATASARLAALRADGEDVQRLRGLCEEFRLADSVDALRRDDSRFHIGLGVAAQSRRLVASTVQIQGELTPLLWLPPAHQSRAGAAAREHAEIVDAIAAGDAARAQALAVAHCERDAETVIDGHLELVLAAPKPT
ncbi:FadR/GntR family transcriptional regulator [Streptomyces sioyaensis]|uniref:FadR/GntR family transcriptional regulator n=1 Tax=Streptomyces sioyaensis TaxID=67364 RepID=UPI00371A8080